MLALSTAWAALEVTDGNQLLDAVRDAGLSALELDYRVTEAMLRHMRRRLRSHEFSVVSVHNYCPLPEGVPQDKASGDLFLLSSPDEEERRRAVKFSIKSVHLAADLEAKAVVFHLGAVGMENPDPHLRELYEQGLIDTAMADAHREQCRAERLEKRQPFLDAVLLSLDRIHEEAVRVGIYVAVENRLYSHQIPNLEEVGIILEEFAGGNIGYWHDCGHAHVQDRLRLVRHETWLQQYGANLLGVHFHDARGLEDHLAPGSGEVDFGILAKYLTTDTLRVLEVHRNVTLAEVQQAVRFLHQKGLVDSW